VRGAPGDRRPYRYDPEIKSLLFYSQYRLNEVRVESIGSALVTILRVGVPCTNATRFHSLACRSQN